MGLVFKILIYNYIKKAFTIMIVCDKVRNDKRDPVPIDMCQKRPGPNWPIGNWQLQLELGGRNVRLCTLTYTQ